MFEFDANFIHCLVFHEFGVAVSEQHPPGARVRLVQRLRQSHQHFHVLDERGPYQRWMVGPFHLLRIFLYTCFY